TRRETRWSSISSSISRTGSSPSSDDDRVHRARRTSRGGSIVNRVQSFASALAYFFEKNRGRAVLLFLGLTVMVLLNTAHGVMQALVGMIGFLPAFALQLSFAVVFIGAQFFMMFYWLSRPRKYVVTPDDVQIGVNFDSYRGQPDLLDHARSTVRILQGVKEIELRRGEMPQGRL